MMQDVINSPMATKRRHTNSAECNDLLGAVSLNLKGVRKLEGSRICGFPARNVVTTSSCSSDRLNVGEEEEECRQVRWMDMVAFWWGVVGEHGC